jgi:hypothetical protein
VADAQEPADPAGKQRGYRKDVFGLFGLPLYGFV